LHNRLVLGFIEINNYLIVNFREVNRGKFLFYVTISKYIIKLTDIKIAIVKS